jgi:uncharacterized protein YbaP (TraB family)
MTSTKPTSASSSSRPLRLLRWLLTAAVLVAVAWGAAPVQAQEEAQPEAGDASKNMLWTISQSGETVGYLVGSIHFMKPDVYPLPSVYDEAFQKAGVVALETNLDSAQAKSQMLIQQLGTYRGDQTLKSQLADSTYALLQARVDSLGLNLQAMQKLEPWVMSMVVPVMQMQQAGYSGEAGIDRHFFSKAKEAGTNVAAFETAEEQMGFFDDMAPDRQEAYLTYSLREARRNVEVIDEMAAAWQRGDTQTIDAMIQDEMQAQFPDLYQTLIVQRNQDWMPEIKQMLDRGQTPFIVVGAGHVTGPDGLVEMLRQDGYTVEQQ